MYGYSCQAQIYTWSKLDGTCSTAEYMDHQARQEHSWSQNSPFPINTLGTTLNLHIITRALGLTASKEETHHGHPVHVSGHSFWVLHLASHPPSPLEMLLQRNDQMSTCVGSDWGVVQKSYFQFPTKFKEVEESFDVRARDGGHDVQLIMQWASS